MTSKQAFEKIREIMEQYYHQFVKDNIKLETIEGYPINKIEKDLKVLEILKKHLFIRIDDKPFDENYLVSLLDDEEREWDYTCIFVNEEEKDLIKEWLEENNNE